MTNRKGRKRTAQLVLVTETERPEENWGQPNQQRQSGRKRIGGSQTDRDRAAGRELGAAKPTETERPEENWGQPNRQRQSGRKRIGGSQTDRDRAAGRELGAAKPTETERPEENWGPNRQRQAAGRELGAAKPTETERPENNGQPSKLTETSGRLLVPVGSVTHQFLGSLSAHALWTGELQDAALVQLRHRDVRQRAQVRTASP